MPSTRASRDREPVPSGEVTHHRLAGRISQVAVDVLAGAIVAAGNVALAVSFAALLFQGELRGGFALGLWSLLMSMVVTTIVVNAITSIPPISAGPDTSMVAVMTLLAAAVSSQVLALGGPTDLVVRHILLAFSLTTLLAGIVVFLMGAKHWGQVLRFVPFPVVGGFLAATGALLMGSSYKVIAGEALTIAGLAGVPSQQTLAKISAALAFALGVLVARNRIRAPFFLPLAFFSAAFALDFGVWAFAP
jgi:sulfate permease, SulP family